MKTRQRWSRTLIIIGGLAMLVGAVDPLEGSLLIVPGSALAAWGFHLGQSQRRTLLLWRWAVALIVVGVVTLFVMSWFGGLGGDTGRSLWWALVLLPYPVGWLLGVAGLVQWTAAQLRRRDVEVRVK